MAISACTFEVVEFLLEKEDVDILALDIGNRNILHNCVLTAFFMPEKEDSMCKIIQWLEEKIETKTIENLLHQENCDGLRPIEFAAQQGTLKILTCFLNTGIYLRDKKVSGSNIYCFYDVTEYEVGDRHSKSPVNILAYLDRKLLQSENGLNPLLLTWINGKIKSNVIPIVLWIMVRLVCMTLYLLVDVDTSYIHSHVIRNSSDLSLFCEDQLQFHPGIPFAICIAVSSTTLCILCICCDIFEKISLKLKNHFELANDLNGRKHLIASTFFYQICQLCILSLVSFFHGYYLHTLVAYDPPTKEGLTLISLARALIPVFSIWSVC